MSVRMGLAGQAMASIMNRGIQNLDASGSSRQEVARETLAYADALITESKR